MKEKDQIILLECLKYHKDGAKECADDIKMMELEDDAEDDIGVGGILYHMKTVHEQFSEILRKIAEEKGLI